MKNKNIVIFSGGSGTRSIFKGLSKIDQIKIDLVINGYDDGKSTGKIREIVGSMLGPSDFRKNISLLCELNNNSTYFFLSKVLEFRFNGRCSYKDGIAVCQEFIDLSSKKKNIYLNKLNYYKKNLTLHQANYLSKVLKIFLNFLKTISSKNYPEKLKLFHDMSFGNLVLAGEFLSNDRNFNRSIRNVLKLLNLKVNIYNVSKGEPLKLVALKKNGEFLENECSIVSKQSRNSISDLYLISPNQYFDVTKKIKKLRNFSEKQKYLLKKNIRPKLNPEVKKSIGLADCIIYGPGTPHSSLYPSYMTLGLSDEIKKNSKAKKIFISNLYQDFDCMDETQTSLFKKFLYYIQQSNYPNKIRNFVDTIIISNPSSYSKKNNFYDFKINKFNSSEISKLNVISENVEDTKKIHSYSKITRSIIRIINKEKYVLKYQTLLISIIIPCLNEQNYIKKTLNNVLKFIDNKKNLNFEIIVVDGGSTDSTVKIIKKFKSKIFFVKSKKSGKGAALKEGMKIASGDLYVFFPSDNEYDVEDIENLIAPLINQGFSATIGSRYYDKVDLDNRLKKIYLSNNLEYYCSKFGGILIKIIFWIKFQRYISDPFTSLKAFNARIFSDLDIKSDGFNFEISLIANLMKKNNIILDIPVNYKSRSRFEGKKMNIKEGLKCLSTLIKI